MGDPSWYQGLNSPFYTETHAAWREKVRQYVEEDIMPIVGDWDQMSVTNDTEKLHAHFWNATRASAKVGVLSAVVGQPWPEKYSPVPKPAANYDASMSSSQQKSFAAPDWARPGTRRGSPSGFRHC